MNDEINPDEAKVMQQYFRAMAYKPRPKRKRATLNDRTKPCHICGYPLSHQHHLFPIEDFGETKILVPLCANCHEMYHVFYATTIKGSKHATKLAETIIAWCGKDDMHVMRCMFLINVVKEVIDGSSLKEINARFKEQYGYDLFTSV